MNVAAVTESVEALTDHERMQMAQSKVTVSTVGGDPSVFKDIAKMRCSMAWSLHSPLDEKRKRLVPSTRHTTAELRDGLVEALLSRHSRRTRTMMVAVTLIKGLNDGVEDALALAEFIKVRSVEDRT